MVTPGIVEGQLHRDAIAGPPSFDAQFGNPGFGLDRVQQCILNSVNTGSFICENETKYASRVRVNEQG